MFNFEIGSNHMQTFPGCFLIYDGECPVCSGYVQFSAIRKKIPDLQLVSARDVNDPRVKFAWSHGINLNDEMALFYENNWYIGPEVMLKLGATGKTGVMDRFLHAFLSDADVRQKRYRLLVRLRKMLLGLLGRKEIKSN